MTQQAIAPVQILPQPQVSVDPAAVLQALAPALTGAPAGSRPVAVPQISRNAPGKPVSPKGRRFAPGIGSDAVAGGTAGDMPGGQIAGGDDRMQGGVPGSPAQNVPIPPPRPPGMDNNPSDATGAIAAAPGQQPQQTSDPSQGGLLTAMGLQSAVPYLRAAGAGALAASSHNPMEAFAQGFGGAQQYYSQQTALEQQRQDKLAEEQRQQANWEAQQAKSLSDDKYQRQRDEAAAAAATEQKTYERGKDAQARQDKLDAMDDPGALYGEAAKVAKDRVGDTATQEERDKAFEDQAKRMGLGHGAGTSDDPYVPSKRYPRTGAYELQQQKPGTFFQSKGKLYRLDGWQQDGQGNLQPVATEITPSKTAKAG